jgi:hypothetical protein
MAVRIQLRRDTASNWSTNNPVLRPGEVGVETDTLKFKIGPAVTSPAIGTAWNSITAYANVTPTGLSNSLGDYILSADQGNAGGPAELDSNGDLIIPENSIILWNDADYNYTTTLTATEPTADRAITFKNADGTVAFTTDIPATTDSLSEGTTNKYFSAELAQDATADALAAGTHTNITVTYNDAANSISLAAAPGYVDEQAVDAVAAALAAGTHTNITVGYNDAGNAISLTGAVTYTDENAQDAVGNALGTGLSYNDTTGSISVDTTAIQARVADVSDTEIGYLNGVTSAIQTQLNDKAPIASPTFTGTVAGITKSMVGLDNVDNTTDANKPVSTATQTALDLKAPIASPTFTGTVTLPGDPSSSLHAATKQYVDNTASGVVAKPQVLGATTANIDATYNNGTAGVGATLTHNTNGAFPAEAAGASGWAVGKGILVKNQTNKEENGRYYISNMGSPSTPYVLTRCGYCDEASEIPGAYIFVQDGTNAGTGWIQTVADAATFVVGTDDINVYQFSGSGTYTAGTGLTLTGNEYSINTSVTADLSTAQTLTNKTINANANTITVTSANVSDFNEAAQDAVGTILSGDLAYNDSTPGIALNYVTVGNTLLDGVSGSSYGLIGTSTYLDVKNTNGYNKEIELDIAAVKTQLDTDGYLTTSSTSTLTNKTLTSPKINEDVAVTATATELNVLDGITVSTTELNYVDGVTSAIQDQLDDKVSLSGTETLSNKTLLSPTISSVTTAFYAAGLNKNYIVRSYDGTTWSQVSFPGSCYRELRTMNGKLAAIGTISNSVATTQGLVYSDDYGSNWTTVTLPVSDVWKGGGYISGKYVVVGINNAVYSTDLVNWTTVSLTDVGAPGGFDNSWNGVEIVNGRMYTYRGADGLYTENGVDWTAVTYPVTNIQNIIYANSKYTIIGTNNAASSTDGLTSWTTSAMPSTGTWEGLGYGNGVYVAHKSGTTSMAYSSDAVTWASSSYPSSGSSYDFSAITYFNGKFIGLTDSSADIVISSTDGITWVSSTKGLATGQGFNVHLLAEAPSSISSVEIGYLDGVTSSVQTQLDAKIAKSLVDAKGDILVGSADNTVTRLGIGTNGYLLTANSSATNGLEWAAAPVSLPSQTGENGKYLTTDGTDASWATLSIPISTGTATITGNTAASVDSFSLVGQSIEYTVSLSQGSKRRTSKVLVSCTGSAVDMTEFAIIEMGGTMSGVQITATESASSGNLEITVTDAASTNVDVRFTKIEI